MIGYSKFTGLSMAIASPDGESIGFSIETVEGKRLRVECPLAEVGDIFAFLGHLAKAANDRRNVERAPPTAGPSKFAPIPAQGVTFQNGTEANETILIVRLAGFDVAFSTPTDELAKAVDEFARATKTPPVDTSN
jgi:hypothetical protein